MKQLKTTSKIITTFIAGVLISTILSCGNTNYLDPHQATLPSAGLNPEGSDILNTSTNHSAKDPDLRPKINGLEGASYITIPSVNNYGTVSMSYAIDIPKGRAGVGPSVGLSYSSTGGDGLVGIGWNVGTGLGVVSRTTRNGQLYYDERDEFTYNGKRLIKVSAGTGEDGTYRMEIESGFVRLELSDSANGGVWRVYDMSGRVTVFGETKDSRIYHPEDDTKTYTWNFTRSTDLNGNFMEAVYDTSLYEEKHILYLKEIRYTGNVNEGTDANQYVRFHLKDRDDAYVSKAPGFIMKMDKILDAIEVGWDDPQGATDTELWRYTMEYEESEDSHRLILKTVDSSRTTTQPEFIYQPAHHLFVWQNVYNKFSGDTEMDPQATKYFEGDFNGDGISDMVFFNPDNGMWKAAEGSRTGGYTFKIYGEKFRGHDSEATIQFFKGNVTGDYNGDGRADIAMYLPETKEFWVAEHNGQSFEFKLYGRQYLTDVDIFKCRWFPGDYDGNGLSDSVLFDESTGKWLLMRNMGGRFEFQIFSHAFQHLFRNDYSYGTDTTTDTSPQGRDAHKVHFLSGDYNGDGRTDISIYDSRNGKWYVGENHRKETAPTVTDVTFEIDWRLYGTFDAPEQALFGHDRFSGDFNGDGFSDFLVFDRDEGEWWIGEVGADSYGNGTLAFRKYSRMPMKRDITRWLQGDFNGDGRTDIGFYSSDDDNFWIGEATPDGFRYRIYNNMSYGPDSERVLQKAPLPRDEVKITGGRSVVSTLSNIFEVDYKFNGNTYDDRGELVFTGAFTKEEPELLIFNKLDDTILIKSGNSDPTVALTNIDLESESITILNSNKAKRYRGLDGVLYYEKFDNLISSDSHTFNLIHENGGIVQTVMAEFDDIENFDISKSLWLGDDFRSNDTDSYILVLDEQRAAGPEFVLYDGTDRTTLTITSPGLDFKNIFSSTKGSGDRNLRSAFQFFSGRFTVNGSSDGQVLMVDMRSSHKWYLGSINATAGTITFEALSNSGSTTFARTGYSNQYRVNSSGELVYGTVQNSVAQFHKVTVSGGYISQQHYPQLDSAISFDGTFDLDDYPIVRTTEGLKRLVLGVGSSMGLENLAVVSRSIPRPDLYAQFYPFRWIQGDYNGDGKTDIGIFHLAEPYWYFANTVGTVPDMVYRVRNGIGGTYELEYVNSTTLDNVGDDGIPHLPMNYKVCTKITVDDGRGNRVYNKYEYSKGYAFSAFIDGRKETDFFGFTHFVVVDPKGGRTESTYNTVPYDDFRFNRALAGAIKEKVVIGWDMKEYARSTYQYETYMIENPNSSKVSFLVDPKSVETKARNFSTGDLILAKTVSVTTKLAAGQYVMESRTESETDHYTDGVHSPATVTAFSEYEYTEATNELRVKSKRSFTGTIHEVTENYTYDNNGNMTEKRTVYTGTGLSKPGDKVVKMDYDGFGNPIRTTDASGTPERVKEVAYDGRLHQFPVEERNFGDSVTLVTQYIINYEKGFGKMSVKTDPNGNRSYYSYDDYGRLITARADTDSGIQTTASYSYNHSFPLSAKAEQHTGTSDPDFAMRVFYDGVGRTIHSVMTAGTEAGKRYVKTGRVVYDATGKVIRQSQPDWAHDSEIDNYIEDRSERNPTYTDYDGIGRVKKVTFPQAHAGEAPVYMESIYNDPYETITVHSSGRTKTTVKNARGQILYVTDRGVGDDGQTVQAKMGFAYSLTGSRIKRMDLNGVTMNLSAPTDPQPGYKDTSGNNISYWWYDGFGRLIANSDPDRGYTSQQYTDFGDVAQVTDALNRTVIMEYDRMGRMVTKYLPGTEGSVHYTYDSYAGTSNGLGRLVFMQDPAQNKTISYNKLGRTAWEKRSFRNLEATMSDFDKTYTTDFTHDLLGRKKRIEYPADPVRNTRMTVTYDYSGQGTTGVQLQFGLVYKNVIQAVEYDEFGQRGAITWGNGVTTQYEYDGRRRLTTLQSTTPFGGTPANLHEAAYTFNAQDSISAITVTSEVDPVGTGDTSIAYNYQYDGLNRLVEANANYERLGETGSPVTKAFERTYRYAANGNLLGKTMNDPQSTDDPDEWSYSYVNHQARNVDSSLHGPDRLTMEYDDAGNMTHFKDTDMTKSMTYDSSNRITTVTKADGTVVGRYQYDDGGFRVRHISKRLEDSEYHEHDILYPSMYMGLEVQKEITGGGVVENSFATVNNVYLNGVRIAAVVPNGDVTYYLTDQVDSVKVVVDDDGRPVTRTEYYPYGDTWFQEGDTKHAAKYNSQELDKESGLYFYNARYYDAGLSRFVTADRVIDGEYDTQGWNRYSYVKGNPVGYSDPTGNQSKTALWAVKALYNKAKKGVQKVYNNIRKTAKNIHDKKTKFDKVSNEFIVRFAKKTIQNACLASLGCPDKISPSTYAKYDKLAPPNGTVERAADKAANSWIAQAATSFGLGKLGIRKTRTNGYPPIFRGNGGWGFRLGRRTEILYANPSVNGGTIIATSTRSGFRIRLDMDRYYGVHAHWGRPSSIPNAPNPVNIHRSLNPFKFGKPKPPNLNINRNKIMPSHVFSKKEKEN